MSTLAWIGVAALCFFLMVHSDTVNAATATQHDVSNDFLNQVADLEQFSPTAYPDGSSGNTQLYSIGYGHQIQPGETYLLNSTITQDQALQLLQSDLQKIADILNSSEVSYTQGQFEALLDFGFSSGTGALMSAVEAYINQGEQGLTNYLQNYIYWHPIPGGPAQASQNLINRRNTEIALFNE